MQSLVQLFSTVSVQYVPAWSKETVALLRKVSARPAQSAGRLDTRRCGGAGSPEREWAGLGGWVGSLARLAGHGGPLPASWAACPSLPRLPAWPGPGLLIL